MPIVLHPVRGPALGKVPAPTARVSPDRGWSSLDDDTLGLLKNARENVSSEKIIDFSFDLKRVEMMFQPAAGDFLGGVISVYEKIAVYENFNI